MIMCISLYHLLIILNKNLTPASLGSPCMHTHLDMSGGLSLKTMACSKVPLDGAKDKKAVPTHLTTGAISLKRKAPNISGLSKRSVVTPSSNSVSCASSYLPTTRPSPSYIEVGV